MLHHWAFRWNKLEHFFFYIKITLIPIPEVLHSILKVFVKSGNDNNGVEINFSFDKLKHALILCPI